MKSKLYLLLLILFFGSPLFYYKTVYAADGFVLPVAGGNFRITQYPGGSFSHSDPVTREAYDLAGNGVPVAVGNGKVTYAGWDNKYDSSEGYGLYVKIQHPNGLVSIYGHLWSISVSMGEIVQQGQQIGAIDSTGFSTGDHLHFSLFKNHVAYSSVGLIDFSSLSSGNFLTRAFNYIFNVDKGGGPVEKIDLIPISGMVEDFYKWALGAAGIVAFGVLIYGGILYMSSAGNASKQTDAKEWIKAAISGLVLLFSAYTILYTINPCIVGVGSGCV